MKSIKFTYDMSKYKKGAYKFKEDIKYGHLGEMEIAKLLGSVGFTFIHQTQGKDSRYDLMMEYNQNRYTYEIKTDVYERDTGNIVIEFECRGAPSGISVTEADYFTTFFPFFSEVWNIKTSKLKELISDNELPISEYAGDKGSNTKLYKINKNKYRSYFKVYKIE
jgi:hypothetical protein